MDIDDLKDFVKEHVTDPVADPVEIIAAASTEDALRRLGEMRLLATSEEGVLGITRRGRDVMLTMLFAFQLGIRFEESPAAVAKLAELAVMVAKIVCFEDMPAEVQDAMATYAASIEGDGS